MRVTLHVLRDGRGYAVSAPAPQVADVFVDDDAAFAMAGENLIGRLAKPTVTIDISALLISGAERHPDSRITAQEWRCVPLGLRAPQGADGEADGTEEDK